VLAASVIVGVSVWRGKSKAVSHGLPGEAIASSTDAQGVLTVPGRMDDGATGRTISVGDGPDKVPFVSRGRPLVLEGKGRGLAFPRGGSDAPAGHAYLDVATDGDALMLEADVTTEGSNSGVFSSVKALLSGPPPEPKSALVLLGDPGRYAAVVISGSGGAASLEWALGDKKRGTTLGSPSPRDGATTHVELSIDKDGELRAFAGSGKDRRPIGEPVSLGKSWRAHFEKSPRAALGCLDGACQFARVQLSLTRDATTTPVATPTPLPSTTKSAVAKSAATPVKTASVRKAPAPVKKTARTTSTKKRRR
jgi:hypothetical protein